MLIAFSCHFDHEGDDVSGGSLARVNSAKLVMSRARSMLRDDAVDVVIVAGDTIHFEIAMARVTKPWSMPLVRI